MHPICAGMSGQSLGKLHRDTHIKTQEVALKVGDSFTGPKKNL